MMKWIEAFVLNCIGVDDDLDSGVDNKIGSVNDE